MSATTAAAYYCDEIEPHWFFLRVPELGRGGEGVVYGIKSWRRENPEDVEPVAKIRLEKLGPWTPSYAKAVENIKNLCAGIESVCQLFGPVYRSPNDRKHPVGVTMAKAEGVLFKHAKFHGVMERIEFCEKLADGFDLLDSRQVYISDANDRNLLKTKHGPLWIDSDSFSYDLPVARHESPITTEYAAPEMVSRKTKIHTPRTAAHSLACLIYQTLKGGWHPAVAIHPDGRLVGVHEMVNRKEWGRFLHKRDALTVPDEGLLFQELPRGIRDLFDHSFRLGLFNPELRPLSGRWLTEIQEWKRDARTNRKRYYIAAAWALSMAGAAAAGRYLIP